MLRDFADKINMPDILEIPQLSFDPQIAIQQLQQIIEKYHSLHAMRPLCFIGSSLGGYYATWLAENTIAGWC